MLRKMPQRIIISGEQPDALEVVARALRSQKLKDTKVSPVEHMDGRWRCIIDCMLAETLYCQEVLPLLYDSPEAQSFEIVLDFADDNILVAHCASEILVSFSLNSRMPYGDTDEHAFVQKIRRELLEGNQDLSAIVVYYIVGGGTVTMCIPCANPEVLKKDINRQLNDFGIKKLMINVVEREQSL